MPPIWDDGGASAERESHSSIDNAGRAFSESASVASERSLLCYETLRPSLPSRFDDEICRALSSPRKSIEHVLRQTVAEDGSLIGDLRLHPISSSEASAAPQEADICQESCSGTVKTEQVKSKLTLSEPRSQHATDPRDNSPETPFAAATNLPFVYASPQAVAANHAASSWVSAQQAAAAAAWTHYWHTLPPRPCSFPLAAGYPCYMARTAYHLTDLDGTWASRTAGVSATSFPSPVTSPVQCQMVSFPDRDDVQLSAVRLEYLRSAAASEGVELCRACVVDIQGSQPAAPGRPATVCLRLRSVCTEQRRETFMINEMTGIVAEEFLFFTENKGWAAVSPVAASQRSSFKVEQLARDDVILYLMSRALC